MLGGTGFCFFGLMYSTGRKKPITCVGLERLRDCAPGVLRLVCWIVLPMYAGILSPALL